MLNSVQECPDIDLYVYFACALAFPYRDPSFHALISLSLSPGSLFSHSAIPSSYALSNQLHIGSGLHLVGVHFPHHRDDTPAPDRPLPPWRQTRSMDRRERPPEPISRISAELSNLDGGYGGVLGGWRFRLIDDELGDVSGEM